MKRWKNMAAFFLALALVANMLFAGKIVAEADEMEEGDGDDNRVVSICDNSIGILGKGDTILSSAPKITLNEVNNVQTLKVKVGVKNDMEEEYTLSDRSYAQWTIYDEDHYLMQTVKAPLTFVELDSGETGIPVGKSRNAYFTLTLDSGTISGEAELNEMVLYGQGKNPDYTYQTYYGIGFVENTLSGYFSRVDDEGDFGVELEDILCNNPLNFTVENLNSDQVAPVITDLKRVETDEGLTDENYTLFTGEDAEFSISYNDERSDIDSIKMTFVDENLNYEMTEYCDVDPYVNGETYGKEGENKVIQITFDSCYKTLTGKFTLSSIEISDIWGNTRLYSDKYPGGEQIKTFGDDDMASILSADADSPEEMWKSWKAACSFERILCTDGVEITGVTLDPSLYRNVVAPGTQINAKVTVKNNSEEEYTINSAYISWCGPTEDEEYIETSLEELSIVVEAGKSKVIQIPVQIEKNVLNGKRTLLSITLCTSEYDNLYAETDDSGNLYSFWNNNLTNSFLHDADFTVGTPAVAPVNPSGNTQNLTSNTRGNINSGTPAEVINRKLKGTKITSLKAAKKKVVVKWKKQTKKTKGYQLQYSTDKKFQTGVKAKTINGNKKTSTTLKGLKSKKTYYVRIRTWQKTSTGKAYSTWSKAKKAKVK